MSLVAEMTRGQIGLHLVKYAWRGLFQFEMTASSAYTQQQQPINHGATVIARWALCMPTIIAKDS